LEGLTASCSTLWDWRRKMPGSRDVVGFEGRQGLIEYSKINIVSIFIVYKIRARLWVTVQTIWVCSQSPRPT